MPNRKEWQRGKGYERLLAFLNSHQPEDGLTPEDVQNAREKRFHEIRNTLIRLFVWRGCLAPEDLADETFERVVRKLEALKDFEGNPADYVRGFVTNIYRENLRKAQIRESLSEKLSHVVTPSKEKSIEAEHRNDCLEKCLKTLSDSDERLIRDYYKDDKRAKIDHRAEIVRKYKLKSVNALRLRCFRIRRELRPCLQECLGGAA